MPARGMPQRGMGRGRGLGRGLRQQRWQPAGGTAPRPQAPDVTGTEAQRQANMARAGAQQQAGMAGGRGAPGAAGGMLAGLGMAGPPPRSPALAAAARPGMSQAMGAKPGGLGTPTTQGQNLAAYGGGVGAPGGPATSPEARAGGLGLGLGLDAQQRGRFLEASQTPGGGQAFIGAHPGLARRIENRIPGGSARDTELQNMLATGQAPSGAQVRMSR